MRLVEISKSAKLLSVKQAFDSADFPAESRIAIARRYAGSASALRPNIAKTCPKLLRNIHKLGWSGPWFASPFASARRKNPFRIGQAVGPQVHRPEVVATDRERGVILPQGPFIGRQRTQEQMLRFRPLGEFVVPQPDLIRQPRCAPRRRVAGGLPNRDEGRERIEFPCGVDPARRFRECFVPNRHFGADQQLHLFPLVRFDLPAHELADQSVQAHLPAIFARFIQRVAGVFPIAQQPFFFLGQLREAIAQTGGIVEPLIVDRRLFLLVQPLDLRVDRSEARPAEDGFDHAGEQPEFHQAIDAHLPRIAELRGRLVDLKVLVVQFAQPRQRDQFRRQQRREFDRVPILQTQSVDRRREHRPQAFLVVVPPQNDVVILGQGVEVAQVQSVRDLLVRRRFGGGEFGRDEFDGECEPAELRGDPPRRGAVAVIGERAEFVEQHERVFGFHFADGQAFDRLRPR